MNELANEFATSLFSLDGNEQMSFRANTGCPPFDLWRIFRSTRLEEHRPKLPVSTESFNLHEGMRCLQFETL